MTLGRRERMAMVMAGLLAACGDDGGETPGGPEDAGTGDPGSLVRATMESQVGVLLDELPEDMRERVAEDLLAQDEAFWTERAVLQIEHTLHRLLYRQTYYDDARKRQLPLPQRALWKVTLDPEGARRAQIAGHDMIVIGYALDTLLLSDAASPGQAEPALADIGGVWEEPFVLPVDPMFLFQRTGYACMDETGDLFDESARWSFDHTCEVEAPGEILCHRDTPEPVTQSCIEALEGTVGKVETAVRFERLPWDPALADGARLGTFTQPEAGDVEPLVSGLANHWLVYRYIAEDSCAVLEQCVTGSGWRRLLMFDGSVRNVGGAAMHIGLVDGVLGSALVAHRVYEHSPCHDHYHFRFYGDFALDGGVEQLGEKQAFCLQSTQRYFNNEGTPLLTPYHDCSLQGISPGWGDDYLAGLDCQWLDVTDIDIPGEAVTRTLRFALNPEGFLCEGTPVTDDAGRQVFEPTTFVTEQGEPIDRPVCEQAEGWDENNLAELEVEIPQAGGFIHAPCPEGALGPARNCGFAGEGTPIACTPGETVTLSCQVSAGSPPQVARFCEVSDALGAGVACAYRQSVASAIVTDTPVEITLTCPAVRDAAGAGGYAMYTAPVYAADAAGEVTCAP